MSGICVPCRRKKIGHHLTLFKFKKCSETNFIESETLQYGINTVFRKKVVVNYN